MVLTGSVHLIDATELADLRERTVLDVRWRLGGPPARPAYLAAHLPGAAFIDFEAEMTGPAGAGGRHPLPDPAVLQAALRRAGVRGSRPVVVYDDGECQAAARAWWTLRWAGHPAVTVLNGGLAAWPGPTRSGAEDIEPGDFTVRPGQLPVLDADGAAELAKAGVLIDARVPVRFRGEAEPIDPVAGRVPGAVNVPAGALSRPDGGLRSPAELRAIFEASGVPENARVGAYCGSGVTAANTVLALAEAGYPEPALYVGSWSEWITNPARPVGTG